MGLFGKKETEIPVVMEPVVEEKKIEGTVIAEGITFVGDFDTHETLELKGTIKGNIVSPDYVHIDATGFHKGNIEANVVEIDGTVDSDINCKDTTKLNKTAKVVGNLHTANIDAAHGSEFNGKLDLKHAAVKAVQAETPVLEDEISEK